MHPALGPDIAHLLDRHDHTVGRADQVAALFNAGVTDPDDLAMMVAAPRDFVLETLESAAEDRGGVQTYEPFFAEGLGVSGPVDAERTVQLLDTLYFRFGLAHDHAGQLATLQTALRLFNQARWAGHPEAATVVREWLRRSIE